MRETPLSRIADKQMGTPNPIGQVMSMTDRQTIVNMGLDPDELISFGGGWANHYGPEELRLRYVEICSHRDSFHMSGAYSATAGDTECRRQIANFEKTLFGAELTERNIIVGVGSTQLTHDLTLTVADPGDSILLPDPTYPNYYGQIEFALRDSRQIQLPMFNSKSWSYAPNRKEVLENMQELYEKHHPKIILFARPDNPTGQIVPQEVIRSALEMAEDGGSYVVIDFAYKTLCFRNAPEYFSWSPVDHRNLVTIHSNSKWGRGLGRRLGWIEASEKVVQTLERTQQCTILCPDTLHQMALTAYLKKATEDGSLSYYVNNTRDQYRRAAQLTVQAIEKNLPYRFLHPEGGLYTVLDVEMDSQVFVPELLRHTGVVFIPGTGFGPSLKTGVRISYGPLVGDPQKIEEGILRVRRFLKSATLGR